MPELPEVETIVRSLRDGGRGSLSIMGKKILKAKVSWDRTIETPSVPVFKKRVINQTVLDVSRSAKYIHIHLSQDSLLIHLRMSGDILVGEGIKPLGKYSRMALFFENNTQLSFENPRKFGRVWLLSDTDKIFKDLGPEPLDPEFSPNLFFEMLRSKKRQIKPLLMDQKFIAGIGNIYADEALNLAKIHPATSSDSITLKEARKLLKALNEVLQEGIRRNGASIDWVYKGGGFQNYFRVYQRTDEPCLACYTPISRIVIGQRGTHFCPKCQPDPNS